MALLKKTQRSFAGGMLDKDLTGRQDLKKYSEGCLELVNFKVRKQGNVIKRSGTNLVCDFSNCLGSTAIATARLFPLIQERASGFYLLFTGGKAFIIGPNGMKMNNGTWSQSPMWSASATWSPDSLPEGRAFTSQPTFNASTATWTWTDTGSVAWTAPGAAKDVNLTFTAMIGDAESCSATAANTTKTFTATRTSTSTDWTASGMPAGHTFGADTQPTKSGSSSPFTWTWTDVQGTEWTASSTSTTVKTLTFSATIVWWTASGLPTGHTFDTDTQPTFNASTATWTWTDVQGTEWTASGAASATSLTFSALLNAAEYSFTATYGNSATYTVPYSITIPFADADLRMLDWCQSGDTLFFAHRSYAPSKIVYADGAITYSQLQFRQGLGTPPAISNVEKLGTNSSGTSLWSGTGGEVTLEYAVTAVKDGVETGPSVPFATTYNAPWPSGGSVKITIDSTSIDADDFDTFYIYKKISDVFGLIGTTSNQINIVDVSTDFAVDGSLYPTGFTTFDKTVHLRESGNKFAAVSEVTNRTVGNYSVVDHRVSYVPSEGEEYPSVSDYIDEHYADRASTTTGATTKSSTAQKKGASSVAFTLPTEGVAMTSFSAKIGGLTHALYNDAITNGTVDIACFYDNYSYQYDVWVIGVQSDSRSVSNKWTGRYSDFTPCPAKFFKATVEYYDDDAEDWVTSDPIACEAAVDQTSVGSQWVAQSGTSPTVYRRTYADSEYKLSYNSAAECIALMDEPEVGATVKFEVPSAIQGKKIRKVTVYGYTSSAATTAADLIVNGIACYQGGKYVYTFTDENITPDLTITPPKTEDHFVNPGEYPGAVQIYQQRLVYASSANYPFTVWMSCTGDLCNFDSHEYVRSSDAITASTAALEMPRINRMLVHRDLMLFADGGEWQVAPSSGNAIAPSTIAAKLQSAIGSAAWLKPIAVDSDIVYCDREGEALYATRYNFASDGYESTNLSVLSQRLFRNNPIESFAYAQFPESTFECVLADGTVASLVYMKEHEVCAWSLNRLGGDWKAVCVAANKSTVSGSSDVAFVARRSYEVTNANDTTSTATEWAVLGLRDIDPNDTSLKANLRMDAVRVVTSSRVDGEAQPPTAGHGETVVRIGETRSTTTTTSGDTTTTTETVTADIYAIGCTFTSTLKTTSPEFTNDETAQMEVKNATEAEVRVIDGSGFTARQPEIDAAKATQMLADPSPDTTPAAFTVALRDADCRMPLVGTNSWNGSLVIEHPGYLPLTVLSVSTAYRVEYANHANGGSSNGR